MAATYPDLAGKRVLVSGGASGIGEALVAAFAGQNALVGFVDLDEEAGNALVERLGGTSTAAPLFRRCDVTDLGEVERVFGALAGELGGVDVLVNNAGSDDRHPVDAITPAYWRERLAVNLDHYFFAARAVLPAMRAGGGGAIVNLGSVSWRLNLPDLLVYQTAKAAIEGLTRSLARELGRDGIRVNAVLPGSIDTPRQARWLDEAAVAGILADQCLPIRIQPADVAAMALFLASEEARACTGQCYIVDAGLS